MPGQRLLSLVASLCALLMLAGCSHCPETGRMTRISGYPR